VTHYHITDGDIDRAVAVTEQALRAN
jgi:hypothetical protein